MGLSSMRELERIFKALADRNRLRIMKMLEVKPMCVCEITAVLGIAQPSVSRHLSILRDADLLDGEKYGIWTNYSLSRSTDDIVSTVITSMRRWGNDDHSIRSDKEKAMKVDRQKVCAVKK
jgi:ArsR family transcriptional regulator